MLRVARGFVAQQCDQVAKSYVLAHHIRSSHNSTAHENSAVQSMIKSYYTNLIFPLTLMHFYAYLQEYLYCVISRINSNNLLFVVNLNNKCVYCIILMEFRPCIFHIQQFKLLQHFENATFPLTLMVICPKIVKK